MDHKDIGCIENYPLTHAQKRIWYLEKLHPGTSMHNIGGIIRIKGMVDLTILEESIQQVIKINDSIRIRIDEDYERVTQSISGYQRKPLDVLDFTQDSDPEEQFNVWVNRVAREPFQLLDQELFYFAIFKLSKQESGYLIKLHHIISDGWSTSIITDQISQVYTELSNGRPAALKKPKSYIEYYKREQSYLESSRFAKDKSYWQTKFTKLPESFLLKSSSSTVGKRKSIELDTQLSFKIKELVTANKLSLNTFFVMLYCMYLTKYYHEDEVVIGTPVLNRSGFREKKMIGMFTSTMPFAFKLEDKLTVLEHLAFVNTELVEGYYHQKYPYDLLVQDLELHKRGLNSLYNVCVNYYNARHMTEVNGMPAVNVEFYNGSQHYAMQIVVKDWSDSGKLLLDIDYKVNDFQDEVIEDISSRLTLMAEQMVNFPHAKVSDIVLLTETEKNRIIFEFNSTDRSYPIDKTIIQLFEEQVEKTPTTIAVSDAATNITYRELNEKANQLAAFLITKGVTRESVVCIMTEHSIESIWGILGILKANGAYLPIDPSSPQERVKYIIEDSGCSLLLTNCSLHTDNNSDFEVVQLNELDMEIYAVIDNGTYPQMNHLAYVIYTSGSTGKPKGTMIEHKGLVNYIWWAKQAYDIRSTDIFPFYSSLSFDLTITSIFTPLILGGEIIVYRDDSDEYVLYRIMKDNKSTIIKLTPSHLSLILDLDNRRSVIKKVIVGGEDLSVKLAINVKASFGDNVELYNEYGPTETVVGCMIHRYDSAKDTHGSVPIGVPASNVQIYILDKNLNPVPTGAVGELYISGDGVARGYLNNDKLTNERFMTNPFFSGKRMYKTGDLAKFNGKGEILFIGRADQQIKIRGYRVELGEIENCLLHHDAIKEVVVSDFIDGNGSVYLCAYIVKSKSVSSVELREYMADQLPDYMVPHYFIDLEELPLTVSGKVNKSALPKPSASRLAYEHSAPRNRVEELLLEAISEVLQTQQVSKEHNFYHIGGDSIKAIQIASYLNKNGYTLKVKDILGYPLIVEMASKVGEMKKHMDLVHTPAKGTIKKTPIVSWFFSHNHKEPGYYNHVVTVDLQQEVDLEDMREVIKKLMMRHDSLRINCNPNTGNLFYNDAHCEAEVLIKETDLSHLPHALRVDKLKTAAMHINRPFDLTSDLLVRFGLFHMGKNDCTLLLCAHHLIVDGVSWRLIIDDIRELLKGVKGKSKIALSPTSNSYFEWAEALWEYSKNKVYEELAYWREVVDCRFRFPTDHHRIGDDLYEYSKTITRQLCPHDTQRLLTNANRAYRTETQDLIIASLFRTIERITCSKDIVIDIESHGRNDDTWSGINVSRTVGWFTSIFPLRNRNRTHGTELSSVIKDTKEEIRKVRNNGVGYGVLKYMTGTLVDKVPRDIKFNYLGDLTFDFIGADRPLLEGYEYVLHSDKENQLSNIIDINCYILRGALTISLMYSINKFHEHTMMRFLDNLIETISDVVDHCCKQSTIYYTPSDFDMANLSQEDLDELFD